MTKLENCPFCVSAETLQARLRSISLKIGDRGIYRESANFVTTVDQHPLTNDPYFLVIPRDHITSFAKMPANWTDELREHLEYIQKCTRRAYPNSKMTMVIFEHGQNADGNSVKSVYHAHLHVLWMDVPAKDLLNRVYDEYNRQDIDRAVKHITQQNFYLQHLKNEIAEGEDYLYFFAGDDDSGEQNTVLDHGCYDLRSQFFRVLIAEAAGESFVNWKTATPAELKVFGKRLETALPPKL